MKRKLCRTILAISALWLYSPGALLAAEPKIEVDKPNIIFILADDLGKDGVGCYGSNKYKERKPDTVSGVGQAQEAERSPVVNFG